MPQDLALIIRNGDTSTLERLISQDVALVHSRPDNQRTLLHIATDWPGHFRNVRLTIATLVTHGADVNAKFAGGAHTETPLHWAASSDDVEALDALLEHGADIESTGAVIAGGTPLADAVAFGTWRAARRLIAGGAQSTLWQSAALGLLGRVKEQLASQPTPAEPEITNAFWNACHGGQLETARYLLGRGADLHAVGHDQLTPWAAALRNGNPELVEWLRAQGAAPAPVRA